MPELGLKVGKQDFLSQIEKIDQKMANLADVISKYRDLKTNLDQFVQPDDSSYEKWCRNIDEHINAAGKARGALNEQKLLLQKTVEQMENLGTNVTETVQAAAEAVKSTAEAAIKASAIL